jgi:hypothetical protein
MLPPAIKGQVVETELSVNTSSEFQDSRVAAEIADSEDTVNLKKRWVGNGSVGSRSHASSARSNSADKTEVDVSPVHTITKHV